MGNKIHPLKFQPEASPLPTMKGTFVLIIGQYCPWKSSTKATIPIRWIVFWEKVPESSQQYSLEMILEKCLCTRDVLVLFPKASPRNDTLGATFKKWTSAIGSSFCRQLSFAHRNLWTMYLGVISHYTDLKTSMSSHIPKKDILISCALIAVMRWQA